MNSKGAKLLLSGSFALVCLLQIASAVKAHKVYEEKVIERPTRVERIVEKRRFERRPIVVEKSIITMCAIMHIRGIIIDRI